VRPRGVVPVTVTLPFGVGGEVVRPLGTFAVTLKWATSRPLLFRSKLMISRLCGRAALVERERECDWPAGY